MVEATHGKGAGTILIKPKPEMKKKEKIVFMKLKPEKHVQWTEDTIDNEHLGRKKSKSK